MNNLEELSIQLDKLRNGDWVKINVHYNINGALLDLCERINKDINQRALGLIRFGTEHITIPHISIYMGYINSFAQFETVLYQVETFAKSMNSFRVDPTRLYLKSVDKNAPKYLFLDILQNETILEQKKYFCDLFSKQLKPMEWDFVNEPSHITVGCYKGITSVAENQIEKYHEFPFCEITDIGVSIAGSKGVCLGNLKTFKLKTPNVEL